MKSERERELRALLRWLEKQVAATKRALEPFEPVKQGELVPAPPKPPRKRSEAEDDYDEYRDTRRTRLEELGVEVVDETPPAPAFVNASMMRCRHACRAVALAGKSLPLDDEQRRVVGRRTDELLAQLFDHFFVLEYPARMEPPYPYNAFVKKWPELLAEISKAGSSA